MCCQGRQRAALPLISWHVHGHMDGDAFPELECLTRLAADKEGLSTAWRSVADDQGGKKVMLSVLSHHAMFVSKHRLW
jgi:hypothetical protein